MVLSVIVMSDGILVLDALPTYIPTPLAEVMLLFETTKPVSLPIWDTPLPKVVVILLLITLTLSPLASTPTPFPLMLILLSLTVESVPTYIPAVSTKQLTSLLLETVEFFPTIIA